MYDELIIEEIRRKQKIEDNKQPQLELPLEDWVPNKKIDTDDSYRSKVMVIDLNIE